MTQISKEVITAVIASFILGLFTGSYYLGKLEQKVSQNTDDIAILRAEVKDNHDEQIEAIKVILSELRELK